MYQHLGDTGIVLYDFFNNLSVFILVIFNFTQIKYKVNFLGKYSINIIKKSKKSSVLSRPYFFAFVETIIVSVFQFAPVLSLNIVFGKLVNTGTNYFGLCFILPIILMIVFLLLGIQPLKQLDLITPAFALTLITIKLACFCHGCCSGLKWDNGLYNYSTEQVEFPIQLVEVGLAVVIFIFLMLWRKKAKEGTMFPIYLILYSGTRFFVEFFKAEPNVVLNLKTYHLLCISGVAVGFIELLIVKKYSQKIVILFDSFSDIVLKKLDLISLKFGIRKEKNIIHHKKRKR